MNDAGFDDMARAIAGGRNKGTRRSLLKAIGLGGVAVAVGNRALESPERAFAQGATPPANMDSHNRRLPGTSTVDDKAFELEYDIERIFRFVADEVQYEAYPGILRGAKGALWGLAGNSADQSMLLAELLTHALVPVRFAVGVLDQATEDTLLGSMHRNADAIRHHMATVNAPRVPTDQNAPSAPLTPEQEAQVQSLSDQAQQLLTTAKDQLNDGIETITKALDAANMTLPIARIALPSLESTQHVWVQYGNGAEWVDLDPSIPGAAHGTAYAVATTTLDVLGDDLFHTVRFSLTAEIATGDEPVKQTLLTYLATSADLVGVPITVTHLRPDAFKATGYAIAGAIEGATQYIPHLIIGDDVSPGALLTFGTGGGLSSAVGTTASSIEAIAEWLEIDVIAPDHAPLHIARTIFDRVEPAARALGTFNIAAIPPVEITQLQDLGGSYLPLEATTVIAVFGGDVPFRYFQQDFTVPDPIADFAVIPHLYQSLRSGLGGNVAVEHGHRFYLDAPNLTSITIMPLSVDEETISLSIAADLVHQSLAPATVPSTTPMGHPGIVAGVLGQVAERQTISGDPVDGGASISIKSVGRLFEEARRMGAAIRTLTPGAAIPSDIELSDRARVLLDQTLASGQVAILPERPVNLDGTPLTGWWIVDPMTGRTTDLLETGHAASSAEYVTITYQNVTYRISLLRMTHCIALIANAVVEALLIVGVGTTISDTNSSAVGAIAGALGGLGQAANSGAFGYNVVACAG
jgi:hypothetical protein